MAEFEEISFDDIDEVLNPKPADSEFDDVVESALSRRDLLKSVLAFGG